MYQQPWKSICVCVLLFLFSFCLLSSERATVLLRSRHRRTGYLFWCVCACLCASGIYWVSIHLMLCRWRTWKWGACAAEARGDGMGWQLEVSGVMDVMRDVRISEDQEIIRDAFVSWFSVDWGTFTFLWRPVCITWWPERVFISWFPVNNNNKYLIVALTCSAAAFAGYQTRRHQRCTAAKREHEAWCLD